MTARETGASEEAVHLDDAFALLGNETRMAVLQVLWDAREPFASQADNALSFSELRERVGMADPGQFNYHLNQLVGKFVGRTEGGYVLRTNAVQVLRAAVVRSEIGAASLPATDAEDPCPFCGAVVEVTYADDQLVVRCGECPGEYVSEISPEGTLLSSPIFPPTGIEDRTGQELWEALFDHLATTAFGFLRDVCPECAGLPTASVDVCRDHATAGICEGCGSTQAAMATVRCETCTFAWRVPAWVTVMTHPDAIAFFHEHGLDADGGLTLDMYTALLTASENVRSTDPLELEIAVELAGDELVAAIDGELTVTDVRT